MLRVSAETHMRQSARVITSPSFHTHNPTISQGVQHDVLQTSWCGLQMTPADAIFCSQQDEELGRLQASHLFCHARLHIVREEGGHSDVMLPELL